MKFFDYRDWLLNENRMRVDWTEKDDEEWEKLHMENLDVLSQCFRKHRAKWWVDSGTLLGIYRDGRIIPGDSDTDVGIMCDDINSDLISDMEKHWNMATINGMFYHHKDLQKLMTEDKYMMVKNIKFSGLKTKNGQAVKHKGKEVWADVFIYFPHNKDRIYKFVGGYFRNKEENLQDFTTFQHKGVTLKRPAKTDAFLECVYGRGWETPNPEYNPDDIQCYGGPITPEKLGGTYKYNYLKKDYKIE